MKKITKKFAALALALVTALTCVPLTAQAAVNAPATATVYCTSKSTDYPINTSFTISELSKSDKIKKVKSSNTSVATPYLIQYDSSSWTDAYINNNSSTIGESGSSKNATIILWFQKAGSAKISYTIGKKKYNTKVTVKNYTNPLESLEITGVENGTNLASLANESVDASPLTLSNDQKNATITISAKSGWRIAYASLNDYDGNTSYGMSDINDLSSATLRVGTLKKDKSYGIFINLENTQDGGWIPLYFSINPTAN
jgi:hypothetical protein